MTTEFQILEGSFVILSLLSMPYQPSSKRWSNNLQTKRRRALPMFDKQVRMSPSAKKGREGVCAAR